ncbi:MAG TPA: hypothetical protein VNI61_04700, partial [Gemmatimonadales bacterium]|nr:hypothetical protein [Gemmatimonadales bacterium]
TARPASRPQGRRSLILARYYGADVVIPPSDLVAQLPEITIEPPPVIIPPLLDSLLAPPRRGDTAATPADSQTARGREAP